MDTKQLPTNLGYHYGVRQLSGGVLYPFFPFNPSLNFLKFQLNLAGVHMKAVFWQLPANPGWGAIVGSGNCLVVFHNLFPLSIPF